ncbi:hypothetical protein [Haloarcula litorea]|uniref:hypothetical protein n=1 Tax=Haloarcula litorea TaxID=3032579 RepID=UPI0023E8B9C0|nr:hypothetical protein [Halomicroarcula sp. GDY20]
MPSQQDDIGPAEADEEDRPRVTTHASGDERTVFTEDGNRDGWIATDLTVELTR